MTAATLSNAPNPNKVLFKAFFNATEQLGLDNSQIGNILGLDRTTISRLKNRQEIKAASKNAEFAILLIRIYRALFAMVGGDSETIQHWMTTHNKHLNGTPAKLVCSLQGIVKVTEYLDAIRGKV